MATPLPSTHPRIRRPPRRARPFSAILTALTVTAGCGGSPAAPSPPPGGGSGSVAIRATSALGPPDGLPGVVIHLPDGRRQTTDADGRAVVSDAAGVRRVRFVHPQFVEREVGLRIPGGETVDVSLLPAAHDTREFRELAPRTAGLLKWTRNPRLLVVDHAIDFSQASAGFIEFPVVDRALSPQQIDCLAAGVSEGLPIWTAGRLRWESVEVARVQPGARFRTLATPEGTVIVFSARGIGAGGRAAAYPGLDPFEITRGAVFMLDDFDHCGTGAFLYRHELGHVLGYQHVFDGDSIMGRALNFTRFDLESAIILGQRSPGNRVPDSDRADRSLNIAGPAPGIVPVSCDEWLARARVP